MPRVVTTNRKEKEETWFCTVGERLGRWLKRRQGSRKTKKLNDKEGRKEYGTKNMAGRKNKDSEEKEGMVNGGWNGINLKTIN